MTAEPDASTGGRSSAAALYTLLSVMFINMMGFGVIVPFLPFYAASFHAAPWQIALVFSAYSVGSFFGEPFWGRLSDRIGRKPILVSTVAANCLCYGALAFAPNIWWAIVIRVLGGMAAGNGSVVQGYIADVTPVELRAGRMAKLGAAYNLGFILGPFIGGMLARPSEGPAGYHLPLLTSSFLFVNGLILLAGERARRRGAAAESQQVAMDVQMAAERQRATVAAGGHGPAGGGGRHSSWQRASKQEQASLAVQADRRLVGVVFVNAFWLGAVQILALLPGISRDGIVMVTGMFRGLSRQDAARFSFLLSAPVILAAGVLKIPDLTGPLGAGIRGQVLFGSALSFVGAYLALRFLVRYFSNPARTLTPFAIYCLVAGAGCFIFLSVR